MSKKSYSNQPTQIRKTITGILGILFLFYVVSCDSSEDTLTLSDVALDSIKTLTLDESSENSITLSWDLLKTEEGAVDNTISYTVYTETNDGYSPVFTKDPDTETLYTLGFSVELGGGRRSTVLPVDGTRTAGVTVGGLANETPYRIVVEARNTFGSTTRSQLFAYTASALLNPHIAGVEATSIPDSDEVSVTWTAIPGAQSYLIQASEGWNQFGENILIDNVFAVICPPGSLLCERADQFAEPLEDDKLRYFLRVNKKEKYKLAVVPFNFHDLQGLQSVDEEGRVKGFTEEVLAQVEDEDSVLSQRLKEVLNDPDKVQEVQIEVSVAGAPTDLVLDSTGSTLSARWGHGQGAEYYYAILTDGGGDAVTNTIDRYEAGGEFAGGGYTGFDKLIPETPYTVTVQSLTVIDNTTNVGGEVSATLSTKEAGDTLGLSQGVAGEDLTLINDEAGKLGISWSTPEANSVVGYNVFYWMGGVAPNKPQYVAERGDTNLSFSVPPGSYRVKIDVLSSHPVQKVVTGGTNSVMVYGQPLAPQGLGVAFARGVFTNISDKLYAIGYPLAFTKADTPIEAGGALEDLSYHYRYRVAGGGWIGYQEIADEAIVSLQVDDLSDPATIRNGYGKKYQVEVMASNAGGFSAVETLEFTYKSFPEPFVQSTRLKVETGDRSLTVTWPEVSEVNGSTVVSYTAILTHNLLVQRITTVERKVVFEDLINNQPYLITVIPNSADTGNILTALSVVTGYNVGAVIQKGSPEDAILTAYTGEPAPYTPQGTPEAVVNLAVIADDEQPQATVTWDKAFTGSPATEHVLEYLTDVRTLITNVDTTGSLTDAELSGLSWGGAISVKITNISDSYSQVISNLNVLSATNVFRVKGIRTDTSGKVLSGIYRYYALGTDLSRTPSTVRELTFSEHSMESFKVTWAKPDDAGQDRNKAPARLTGYRVSWGANTEVLEGSFDISSPNTLFYIIPNLTPGTQYYVKVQAKNNNGERNINLGLIDFTYTIKPPRAVSSITYSGHTTNGFKVSWGAVTDAGYDPEGPLASVGYRLEHSSNQGKSWRSVARSDYSSTEEILTDLIPGTDYQVRVTVTNELSLAGTTSEGGETWTLSLPGPVEELVVSDPTYENHTGGFKVSWKVPQDTGRTLTGKATITGYEVTYAEDGESTGEDASVTLGATTTEYVFTGLKTNAKYDIRVQAKSEIGIGLEKIISGWTPSLPKAVNPDSIIFSHSSSSTIQVEWTAPEPGRAGGSSPSNATTLYKVEVNSTNGNYYAIVQTNYSSNVITITNLTSSTAYRVSITAMNIWGSVPISISTFTGRTLDKTPTAPPAVRNFKGVALNDIEALLSWTAPEDMGTTDGSTPATFSSYVVKYKETGIDLTEIDHESEGVQLAEPLTITSTNVKVIGLTGANSYNFLIMVRNSADQVTSDIDAAKIILSTAPPPPTNLAQDFDYCDRDTKVSLSWKSTIGSTKYKIHRGTNIFSQSGTFYEDSGLIPSTEYTYRVQGCDNTGACSRVSEPLKVTTSSIGKTFSSIINSSKIPTSLSGYDNISQEIFSLYNAGASLATKYVKENGSGNKDGSSFDNAADNLKTILDGITDATANNVYVILLGEGTHKPGGEMSMKNHVAIVGGESACLAKFNNKAETYLDGEGKRVFYNTGPLDHTALLYGVTIINGKAEYGGGMQNVTGSSPSLTRVTFKGNEATDNGGGMYNVNSNPILNRVTFSGNTANKNGGGMFNIESYPTMIGVTFFGNSATDNGNAIGNSHNPGRGALIVNGIFWRNTNASGAGSIFHVQPTAGPTVSYVDHFEIYNSIVEGGTGDLENGQRYLNDQKDPISLEKGGFAADIGAGASVMISFNNITATDPRLGALKNNGGWILTHAIPNDSSAVNQGLYVKRKGGALYYSKDNAAWYTKPDLSNETKEDPPEDAVEITAADATEYPRKDGPDLGAYEAR